MSTFDTLFTLRKGVKKANPQMTEEQVRAEVERYFTEELPPMYSEREIFEMLDDPKVRRPGIPHRPMPRYTGEERRERREFSRKLRQSMYSTMQDHSEITNQYIYYQDEGRANPKTNFVLSEQERQRLEADRRQLSRGVGWLFYRNVQPDRFFREHPDATEDDLATAQQIVDLRNEEIAFLFDTNSDHWNAYFAEAVPKRRSGDPALANVSDAEIREEIQAELSQRRTDVLMGAIREALDATKNVYEMADGSLPPEVQGENFAKIARANGLLMDIDNDFRQRNDLNLTEQDRQQLEEWRKLQGQYNEAFKRITIRTNPMYEMLDPELLAEQYDLEALKEKYDDDLYADDRGTSFRAERERKCPEVGRYAQLGGAAVSDELRDMLGDMVASIIGSRDLEIDDTFQSTVEGYGFTLGGENGVECFCDEFDANGKRHLKDEAGVNELKSGRPLLFRQGERVAVLTLKNPMSAAMTWSKPEALFNYGLEAENTALLKQFADSDKWYQTRSGNFKRMREAFEALAAEGKPLSDKKNEREALAKQYREVLKLCDTYIEGKERENVGEGHNDLERGHIRVANALREHLTTKLDEMELADKARHDLEKYRGMQGAEIRADVAREDKYRENSIRRQNLSRWLESTGRTYRNEEYPEAVAAAIQEGNNGIMRFLVIDPKSTASVQHYVASTNLSQENAVSFVGGMIAAEMIKTERAQRSAQNKAGVGPIERSFADAATAQEQIKNLGEEAVMEITGGPVSELGNEKLTRFLATFDAEQLARELPEAVDIKTDLEARDAVSTSLSEAQKKLSSVGLGVYDFATKTVAPQMNDLQAEVAKGTENYDVTKTANLLSSYVILGMMQLEELGSGNRLSRLLRDKEASEVLQAEVKMTKDFGDMLKEVATEKGNRASIEKISKVLEGKKPLEMAKNILLENKMFKTNLESSLKVRGIELGSGVKLGEQPQQQVQPK